MSLGSKKRLSTRLEGQTAGDNKNKTPSNLDHNLLSLGLRRVDRDEYLQSDLEINESFLKVANDDRPFVKIEILDVPLIGLLDSGANRSILGRGSGNLLQKCRLRLQPVNIEITTASGQKLDVSGQVDLPVTFNGVTKIVSALVIPSVKRKLILGSDF